MVLLGLVFVRIAVLVRGWVVVQLLMAGVAVQQVPLLVQPGFLGAVAAFPVLVVIRVQVAVVVQASGALLGRELPVQARTLVGLWFRQLALAQQVQAQVLWMLEGFLLVLEPLPALVVPVPAFYGGIC